MLNFISQYTNGYSAAMPKSLKGLFVGGEGNEICFANERQVILMALTGAVLTYSTGYCKSIVAAVAIGIATLSSTCCAYFVMGQVKNDGSFSLVGQKSWNPISGATMESILSLGMSLTMLCGLNYITTRGFCSIASLFFSMEIAKAASFVMANLLLIYPSSGYVGQSKDYINLSTISGLAGVIAFVICATGINCTNSYSSDKAMFLLKALPIFFACMEAIHQEKYGVKIGHDQKPLPEGSMGAVMKCLLGGGILTAGFMLGDTLTQKLSSSVMLNSSGIVCSVMKLASETLITPSMIIVASAICKYVCTICTTAPSNQHDGV